MTAPHSKTAWVQLASLILGEDLADWVRKRRTPPHPAYKPTGWRVIAAELEDATDGQVHVGFDRLRVYWLSLPENANTGANS